MTKPSTESLELAAQCWCDEETKDRVMDEKLAVAFAQRLDKIVNRLNGWMFICESRSKIIAQMYSQLLQKGVNFDFQKALDADLDLIKENSLLRTKTAEVGRWAIEQRPPGVHPADWIEFIGRLCAHLGEPGK